MNKKIILVTGGAGGLGAKLVETLLDEDTHIYYTYKTISQKMLEMAPINNNVTPIRCDQRNEEEIIDCVSKIDSEQGKIDVLINNACPSFMPCDLLSTGWNQFQDIIDVNVKGSYIFTREAAKVMKKNGSGRIINILSTYVLNIPPEKLSFYITAKYALMGFSKAAAAELCKFGITVNMVSPGLMSTNLSSYLPQRYLEAYSQKHPMKRMTTTDDVAQVINFLSSDSSKFLNGVNIPINGGEVF